MASAADFVAYNPTVTVPPSSIRFKEPFIVVNHNWDQISNHLLMAFEESPQFIHKVLAMDLPFKFELALFDIIKIDLV